MICQLPTWSCLGSPLVRWLGMVLSCALLSGCSWSPTTLAVENPTEATVEAAHVEEKPDADGRLKAKLSSVNPDRLVGTWRDKFFGTRTLTLNADGSAKMVLDLDFAGRLMYGNKLEFDMKWSVDGANIMIDIIDGTPAKNAKSAMDTWGSRYEYLLDCVEDDKIEMRDWDGSMNHSLRRLSE